MTLKTVQSASNLTGVAAEAAQMAVEAGLIYVSDAEPGIRRLRAGKLFRYLTPENRRLADSKELKRIASLAIPPAYEDVWISVKARGHLQATGRDARGRKQYRYHAEWRQVRDSAKFDRMVSFGEALPKLRRKLKRDLGLPGLPREKVLAVIVSILDATRVRIGNTEYARDNKSFGLTTLRNRHVSFIRDGRAVLNFRGKGGVQHEVLIDDRRIAQIMRRCQEIPGQHLFQYVSDDGQRCPIDSGMVNDYLRDAMGADFTAKDFRTWGATLQAIKLLAATPLPDPPRESAFKKHIVDVVKQVAVELRNTPAVCRKSYINPAVFVAWRSGAIHQTFNGSMRSAAPRKAETRVLEFLRSEARSAGASGSSGESAKAGAGAAIHRGEIALRSDRSSSARKRAAAA
jgi:DNA topoisomerase IB